MTAVLFTKTLLLRYLQHSLVIDDLHDDGALFKILTALGAGLPLPGNNELMEKVSLRNREPDGKAIKFGNIGKVHQNIDEGQW